VAATTTLGVTTKPNRRRVRPTELVGWTIVVTNCGTVAASGVSVRDHLHPGATFANRGGGRMVRGRLVWAAGALAPGARKVYRVTARFAATARAGSYSNQVTAVGHNTAPATGRGSTTVS
jgi:uncharacterized repeat protein (TIGR01451 family)